MAHINAVIDTSLIELEQPNDVTLPNAFNTTHIQPELTALTVTLHHHNSGTDILKGGASTRKYNLTITTLQLQTRSSTDIPKAVIAAVYLGKFGPLIDVKRKLLVDILTSLFLNPFTVLCNIPPPKHFGIENQYTQSLTNADRLFCLRAKIPQIFSDNE
uniref:Uncharacterized protein n=1 Tax=Glossina pallidipes TaxID=7398 RepID=A0A1B0AC96_GLOPL